ncbi:MAG TPA: hypothetical protein VG711_13190, partial [Phycisphaerales bacterium]|nr:hypothetical protein [Phycisphaerales bacterium]
MAQGAKVISLSVLTDVKAALIEFSDQARRALSETMTDAQRVKVWLEHEQTVHWQQEIRKRTAKVAEAKSQLYRAQMQSREERPSCVLERKAVVRAEAALQEASEKLQKTKRWASLLDREIM